MNDYMKVECATTPKKQQVDKVLINPNASTEAIELHHFLIDQYGERILSGKLELV